MIDVQEEITQEIFRKLNEVHTQHCVSVFMPTSKNARSDIDKIRFKNQLKKVGDKFSEYGLSKAEANRLLSNAREQLDNDRFWRFLMHGLALFIYDDKTQGFLIPQTFDEYTYVSDHLYLMPLIPTLQENRSCYVLLLSGDTIRFLEMNGDTLKENDVFQEALPQQLEDVVGYDFEQKALQFRSGQEGGGHGMYHGQGAGSQEERKTELEQLFRRINDVITRNIDDKKTPLVVGCVDYLFPIYREINTYPNLVDKPMLGNFSETSAHELAQRLSEHLGQFPDEEKNQKKMMFSEMLSKNLASYKPEDAVPAAINGRIDTLFINRNGASWGKYDPATNSIIPGEKTSPGNVCLLNLAAVQAHLSNARVYLMKPEQMPEENTVINAIFRY